MIFKYDTKKINGKHYIVTSRLISEKGKPDNILEFDKPFDREMLDDNNKLQWRVETIDGKTNIIKDPISLTDNELAKKRKQKIQKLISENYKLNDEIKMINIAIEALANKKPLPKEYISYRLKIGEIKNEL